VSPHVARLLGLVEQDRIVVLERLRLVDGEPLVVTTARVPYDLGAPLLELDMSQRSLFQTYERELGLTLHRGQRTIEAGRASGRVARYLGVPDGSPALIFKGVTYTEEGRPVDYFVGVHRGDRSRFEVELSRTAPDEEAAA
jgi:GntR family transcriptional regulator